MSEFDNWKLENPDSVRGVVKLREVFEAGQKAEREAILDHLPTVDCADQRGPCTAATERFIKGRDGGS